MKREVAAAHTVRAAGNFRRVCPSKSGAENMRQGNLFVREDRSGVRTPMDSGSDKSEKETPGRVFIASSIKYIIQEANKVAASEKIRVRLRSYEHSLVDAAAAKIVDIAKRNGAEVAGPIPLPTEKEIVTILRAVHKYKDSREQFEQRTHKRLIEIKKPSQKVVEALMSVELPAGVDIDLKL